MTIDEDKLALSFLSLAVKYLDLVQTVLSKSIEEGNPHMVVSDEPSTEEKYDEITQFSDFRILVPTLFNFYHGLELLMKGLLCLVKENFQIQAKHGLRELFKMLQDDPSSDKTVNEILASHIDVDKITSASLKDFLLINDVSIDNLYESLRYPMDRNFKQDYQYLQFHYREENHIPFFQKIVADIKNLKVRAVALYQQKTHLTLSSAELFDF